MHSILSVKRYGKRWAVIADGDVLATARRKRDAQKLAVASVRTLRESGMDASLTLRSPEASGRNRSDHFARSRC